MPRVRRRQERRRVYDVMKAERSRLSFAMDADAPSSRRERRQMSSAEISAFIKAIDRNNSSMFGLVKLRKLDIDTLCVDVPWLPFNTTLLEYAARRNRDGIVGSLLRADADPRLRANAAGEAKSRMNSGNFRAHKFLQKMTLRYGTWVFNQVVRMRDAGNAALASKDSENAPGAKRKTCPLCSSAYEIEEPVVWSDCGSSHVCCESCMWSHVISEFNLMNDNEPVLHCPLCQTIGDDNGTCGLSSHIVPQQKVQPIDSHGKEFSLSLFQALPEVLPCRPKKLKFKALSKSELRSFSIGNTRSKRVQNWWRAASDGDYLRLQAIFRAGIDVDAQDENGETALLHAQCAGYDLEKQILAAAEEKGEVDAQKHLNLAKQCLDNYRRASSFLLQLGARNDLPTNAGITARSLMEQRGAWKLCPKPRLDRERLASGSDISKNCEHSIRVRQLIPLGSKHEGAGSWIIDGAFSEEFLTRLDSLWESIPLPDTSLGNLGNGEVDDDVIKIPGNKMRSGLSLDVAETRSFSKTCAVRTFFRDREGWICEQIRTALKSIEGGPSFALPRMRFMHYGEAGGRMMPHVDLSKSDRVGMWRQMVSSTHTFLLHLRDCPQGGETALLDTLLKRGGGILEAMDREQEACGTQTGLVVPGTPKRIRIASASSTSESSNSPQAIASDNTQKRTLPTSTRKQTAKDNPNVLASVSPKRGRLLLFPHVCPHAGLEVVDAPKLFLRGELYYGSNS